jgi:hypothetical protein
MHVTTTDHDGVVTLQTGGVLDGGKTEERDEELEEGNEGWGS